MTENQIAELFRDLEELQTTLAEDLKLASEGSQPVKLDQQAVGRVSRIDAIQQQQMHAASVERLRKRLAQVSGAIQRVKSGSFGACTKCEEPIAFKRLKARPESPLCIECAP